MGTNMKNKPVVITSDITHPSVDLIEITCQARGWFDQDKVRDALKPLCKKYSIPLPRHVALTTALKRAMVDLSRGSNDREVKTKGTKGTSVYTIVGFDPEKLDREEHDGSDIATAEVSARIEANPALKDSYTIKISPPDHPGADLIRKKHDEYCGLYSCTYDIKPWLTQEALPALQAIRTPDALGKYVVKANDRSRSALLELQQCFEQITSSGDDAKLSLYLLGRSGHDASMVDLIADAIMDETERVLNAIRADLEKVDAGEKRIGLRALATHNQKATDLRQRLIALAESMGLGLEDVETQVNEVEKRLGILEAALSD